MKILFTLALALFAFQASADDVLTWKHPTFYTTGEALNAADIQATVIRWAATVDGTILGTVNVAAPATTTTILRGPTPGTMCYQAATLMKNGEQSAFAPAAWVCKTIAALKPKIPSGLTVQ